MSVESSLGSSHSNEIFVAFPMIHTRTHKVIAALIAIIASYPFGIFSAEAHPSDTTKVVTLIDGTPSKAAQRAWDITLLRAGLDPVPADERDAARRYVTSGVNSLSDSEAEGLREALGAELVLWISVKPSTEGQIAARVAIGIPGAAAQRFGSFPIANVEPEVNKLIVELLAANPTVSVAGALPRATAAATPIIRQASVVSAESTTAAATTTTTTTTAVTAAAAPTDTAAEPAVPDSPLKKELSYGAAGFVGLPIGDMGDAFTFGAGALFVLKYPFKKRIELSGRVGLIYLGVDTEPFESEGVEISATTLQVPIWAGARYYLDKEKLEAGYFVHGEVGLNHLRSSMEASLNGETMSQDDSNTLLGANLLGGLTVSGFLVEGGLYIADLDDMAYMLGVTVGKGL